MEIPALGYIGIGASNLADWSDFATGWVGMQMVEHGNASRSFRMVRRADSNIPECLDLHEGSS